MNTTAVEWMAENYMPEELLAMGDDAVRGDGLCAGGYEGDDYLEAEERWPKSS